MTRRFLPHLECATAADRGNDARSEQAAQKIFGAEVLPCNLGGLEIRAQPKRRNSCYS